MESPLSYINSEGFRKEIMVKNLKPYAKSPKQPPTPYTYEYVQSILAVADSPDNILDQALPENKKRKSINRYGDGTETIIDSAPFFESTNQPSGGTPIGYNNQPYPTSFVPSSYSPLSILLNRDPQGSDGLLSQDSFIVKLGAHTLRKEFEERIATQIKKQTIGRANILNVDGVSDIINIIQGNVPIIEPNWTITIPENPILAASDFILRLGGSVLPVSTIPGSYWNNNTALRQPTAIGQLANAFRNSSVGNFVSNLLGTNQSGSQIFYNNTGSGQKSRLFYNIDYNRYKPSYDRTLFNRILGSLVGSTTDSSNFYIGSNTTDPSRILSPSRDLPVNSYGQELQVPVYGPSEISRLYEGPSESIKLGANGPTYSNGGGVEGGFTWVSPKYKDNAGKKVGLNGQISNSVQDFSQSSYTSTESTNNEFRDGSLLDQTQRIINSQPNGGKRLQHVGNAIDQVSKVFNDGYKEMTKGSRVLSYVGKIGEEVGTEYCRVFTKDVPYLQYNDLQKTDGMTTEGRKFAYSVLDKTYNLNIAPNKQEGGKSSSNLISGVGNNLGFAKKYMFSLENLAWRTSNRPGYTVADLPICERGLNGGRVMWFPPYNLTFDETTQANWKNTDFIGRPEPVFTYNNTSRNGSISWDIVVDHPSVLNMIVNKVLDNQNNKLQINGILESFFAGCRKYDLYDLAKKYYKINPNDLEELQKIITNKLVTDEQIDFIKTQLQTGNDSPKGNDVPVALESTSDIFNKYVNFGFYFENAKPAEGQVANYQFEYDLYLSPGVRNLYETKSLNPEQTNNFYNFVIIPNFNVLNKFIQELVEQFKQYETGTVTVDLVATASAPATIPFNNTLASRRMDSVVKYFESKKELDPYRSRLILKTNIAGEESTSSPQVYTLQDQAYNVENFQTYDTITCSDEDINAVGGDTVVTAKEVYTFNAMACRRVYVKNVTSTLKNNVPEPQPNVVPQSEERLLPKNNITKRVLRLLLSECDYFQTIKEETPMVFDNLKQKLKFFHPAFHSITPEGLNSRLTFLQQCMRPGDTIPTVVKQDGQVVRQYNNATNTSFGAPPVLVLRIGDFFNTKIIPKNLSLKYENLDLNPEGIGVQPMIAKVTLSFDFIGGSGLKNSIDKLQNALTFNYYANTEMWDDRADVTDESYEVLDEDFLSSLNNTKPPTPNQAPANNGQTNNGTIGNIISKEINEYETGTISYSDFMVNLKNSTQNYFQTVFSKTKETVFQYNNAVRQVWMIERNYTVGTIIRGPSLNNVNIFGKPKNIEDRFDKITKQLEKDIEDGFEGFISFISQPSRDFSSKAIRQIRRNYVNFIRNKSSFYQNALTKINQDLVTEEQSFIKTLGQTNVVLFNSQPIIEIGTDGFQQKNGEVVVYNISGTTEINPSSQGVTNTYQEMEQDVLKIIEGLKGFHDTIITPTPFYGVDKKQYEGILVYEVTPDGLPYGSSYNISDVFTPFSENDNFKNPIFRRVYMLVSDDITDDKKYNTFKDSIIGNVVNNKDLVGKGRDNFDEIFDTYWKLTVLPLFNEEDNLTKEFMDHVERTTLKDYLNYTPFDRKERVFTFSSEPTNLEEERESQVSLIKNLAATNNVKNKLQSWNDAIGEGLAYSSKVKLN